MLRGINVSGQKKIKMNELISLYESLSFKNVTTYIQSGNVLFDSSADNLVSLAEKIEKEIKKEFLFEVPVIIRTKEELKHIIKTNPFLKREDIDHSKLHITFLTKTVKKPIPPKIMETKSAEDEFFTSNKEIYLFCPKGYGRTKYNNNFFERYLSMNATTRNWNTIMAISRLMDV